MAQQRLFIDAVALLPTTRRATEVWTTEAVLIEVGNALSAIDRGAANRFIERCYETSNMRIVSVDTPLLLRALTLYASRDDKDWGLTDCISFVVMADQGLMDALAADRHFVQAGYRALLLES